MNTDRAFGFRQISDTRDMLFSMQRLFSSGTGALPRVKRWKIGPVEDQGAEGACVGFACHHLMTAEPFVQTQGPTAREIYHEARMTDEFPDDAGEGTSVRAGLETLRRHNLIESFWWAPNVDTLIGYLATYGPAVAGTSWHSYLTDSDGRVRFEGKAVGGHAWLIHGYDLDENLLFGVNSWGPSFGKDGEFYVTFADFAKQLQRGGCAAGVRER